MCTGDDVLSWEVDYSSPFTLSNWIIELDLYCASKVYIGLIGVMFSVGTTIACLILSVIADKYGRVKIFRFGSLLLMPLILVVLYTRSLSAVYFFCFYLGIV